MAKVRLLAEDEDSEASNPLTLTEERLSVDVWPSINNFTTTFIQIHSIFCYYYSPCVTAVRPK